MLKGTIRTLSEAAAARVGERIRQIAAGLSEASGATIQATFRRGTDAVVNDPDVTRTCVRAAGEVVGQANLDEIALPSMGGEDFSGYLKHAPGLPLAAGRGRVRSAAAFPPFASLRHRRAGTGHRGQGAGA